MKLLAIDPGPTESAWLEYDTDQEMPIVWEKAANLDVLHHVADVSPAHVLACEMIASYGMAVGREVFETCVWIGRFWERFSSWERSTEGLGQVDLIYRRDVKLHLCNSARAKDPNVRQALIDKYGGKELAIGKKANPGPLYGLSGDCWAALAVAVTWAAANA